MCFFSKLSTDAITIEHRFNAKFSDIKDFASVDNYNGFAHPATPVITNTDQDKIQLFNWGLIPAWSKNKNIRKYTLNAKFETLTEKPSFKSNLDNRCLVIVNGFYEWQWLDAKGKNKQKYLIGLPDNDLFCLAGLWSEWLDKSTGELIKTYTIITTEANELMSKIHNSKKRMPLILNKINENNWLNGEIIINNNNELVAEKIEF